MILDFWPAAKGWTKQVARSVANDVPVGIWGNSDTLAGEIFGRTDRVIDLQKDLSPTIHDALQLPQKFQRGQVGLKVAYPWVFKQQGTSVSDIFKHEDKKQLNWAHKPDGCWRSPKHLHENRLRYAAADAYATAMIYLCTHKGLA